MHLMKVRGRCSRVRERSLGKHFLRAMLQSGLVCCVLKGHRGNYETSMRCSHSHMICLRQIHVERDVFVFILPTVTVLQQQKHAYKVLLRPNFLHVKNWKQI